MEPSNGAVFLIRGGSMETFWTSVITICATASAAILAIVVIVSAITLGRQTKDVKP